MCLRRAPEKYIAGAALDRAAVYFNVRCGLLALYRACKATVVVNIPAPLVRQFQWFELHSYRNESSARAQRKREC
jgi:hypothetical protein